MIGYDPRTGPPLPCPSCQGDLHVEWFDVTGLGEVPQSSWIPGAVKCPRSHLHNVEAGRAMRFVQVRHPDIENTAEVPLSALDHYRQKGWRPVDPEHMTPSEMVEQRVRDLAEQARLGVLDDREP